jgi:hypothetical protein
MDKEQDDLTLVYMWAYKQAKQEYKDRIDELEAALLEITKTAPFGHPQEIARAALGEKKDG